MERALEIELIGVTEIDLVIYEQNTPDDAHSSKATTQDDPETVIAVSETATGVLEISSPGTQDTCPTYLDSSRFSQPTPSSSLTVGMNNISSHSLASVNFHPSGFPGMDDTTTTTAWPGASLGTLGCNYLVLANYTGHNITGHNFTCHNSSSSTISAPQNRSLSYRATLQPSATIVSNLAESQGALLAIWMLICLWIMAYLV